MPASGPDTGGPSGIGDGQGCRAARCRSGASAASFGVGAVGRTVPSSICGATPGLGTAGGSASRGHRATTPATARTRTSTVHRTSDFTAPLSRGHQPARAYTTLASSSGRRGVGHTRREAPAGGSTHVARVRRKAGSITARNPGAQWWRSVRRRDCRAGDLHREHQRQKPTRAPAYRRWLATRITGYTLAVLGLVIGATHVITHLGYFQVLPVVGWQDLAMGYRWPGRCSSPVSCPRR
jgi:hypothetical protein